MFDPQPDLLTFAPAIAQAAPLSKHLAIKAAGGAEYAALLAKGRAARAKFRKEHPERYRELQRKHGKNPQLFRSALCAQARLRGRKAGRESTITPADLHWPTHCPVLGLQLDYPERTGQRKGMTVQPNWPSLDRYDSSKGYIPGNVFVISCRANTLKSNATYEEILKVAKYLSRRPQSHGR